MSTQDNDIIMSSPITQKGDAPVQGGDNSSPESDAPTIVEGGNTPLSRNGKNSRILSFAEKLTEKSVAEIDSENLVLEISNVSRSYLVSNVSLTKVIVQTIKHHLNLYPLG